MADIDKNSLIENLVEEEEVISYSSTTLEEDLQALDRQYFDTNFIRDKIIKKLTPIALEMDIHPEDVLDRESAAALDSKINVITTLTNLLDAKDKAVKTKIEIKTKQREIIENGKQAELFVSALSAYSKERAAMHAQKSMATADTVLDNRITEITPIMDTELRDDPNDLR